MFSCRYPKAHDYFIMTKAVLRSLHISIDDKSALVSLKTHYPVLDDKAKMFFSISYGKISI